MKKIVALALCLVLALSLCATAFASTGSTATNKPTESGLNWSLKDYTVDGDAVTTPLTAANSITVTNFTDAIDDDGVHTMYATRVIIDNTVYFEVAEDFCEYKLSKGSTVYFLIKVANATANTVLGTSDKATEVKWAKATYERVCGDYTASGVMVDGVLYGFTACDSYAVLNGKFVPYDADDTVGTVPHTFTSYTTKNTGSAKAVVATVKCSECNNSYEVITATGIDKDWKAGVNYVALTNADETACGAAAGTFTNPVKYYAVLDKVVAGSTASTTTAVSSAKTFDAGIALYVGMSISAVAGSAVVIGKKKEF